MKKLIKRFIIKQYRKIALSELTLKTKLIYVKKGKLKYMLFVAKDVNLETVFFLERHSL
jgi:hypothetical protein